MKKIILRILLIAFLLTILVYVTNVTGIPNNVILFQGEKLDLGTIPGVIIKDNKKDYETIETLATIETDNKVENKNVTISLFNVIDIKDVEVNTIAKAKVIPLGNSIGLKLYTSRCACSRKD